MQVYKINIFVFSTRDLVFFILLLYFMNFFYINDI